MFDGEAVCSSVLLQRRMHACNVPYLQRPFVWIDFHGYNGFVISSIWDLKKDKSSFIVKFIFLSTT